MAASGVHAGVDVGAGVGVGNSAGPRPGADREVDWVAVADALERFGKALREFYGLQAAGAPPRVEIQAPAAPEPRPRARRRRDAGAGAVDGRVPRAPVGPHVVAPFDLLGVIQTPTRVPVPAALSGGRPLPRNCLICMEAVVPSKEFRGFLPRCVQEHPICLGCAEEYFNGLARDGKTEFPCPEPSCRHEARLSVVETLLLPDLLERVEQARALRSDAMARECPQCRLVARFSRASRSRPKIACPSCETAFCFTHGGAHVGASCKEYERREKANSRAFEAWCRERTVRCSRCGASVERIDGCNHMTCRCGYQFCWLCHREYADDHFDEDNSFGCPGQQFGRTSAVRMWLRRAGAGVAAVARRIAHPTRR